LPKNISQAEKLPPLPLFVCHANCCRSVLAQYLYVKLNGDPADSAGVEMGDEINDRACGMLAHWGISAQHHRPKQLTTPLCERADAILVMAPEYLRRLLREYGLHLAAKTYLFADPFSMPRSFQNGEYFVWDPSFDNRPTSELVAEFSWFQERVKQIHDALLGQNGTMIPAAAYLNLLETVSASGTITGLADL
jgi:protein-tyrosine-phosphatase